MLQRVDNRLNVAHAPARPQGLVVLTFELHGHKRTFHHGQANLVLDQEFVQRVRRQTNALDRIVPRPPDALQRHHVTIGRRLGQKGPRDSKPKRGPNIEAIGYLSSGSLELFPINLSMWIGTFVR